MGNMGGSSSSSSEVGSKRSKAVEVTYDNSIYEYYYHLDAYSSEENANTVWYKFKPKADGTFRIYLEEIERDYTITVYKNKKQIAVGDLNSDINIELEKGKKYYITVTQSLNYDGDYNYDKYSNYDTNFRFTVGAPIPMGEDADHAYTLQLDYNGAQDYESLLPPPDYSGEKNKGDNVIGEMSGGSGEVWFKYTAITGGEHTFTLTDFDGYANFYFYRSAESGYDSIYDTNSAKYNLVQGNTYYIRLEVRSNYSSLDTNFGVTVEDEPEGMSINSAVEIQLGENSEKTFDFVGKDGDEVWLKFQPTADGYYAFAFESNKEAFTPYYYVYRGTFTMNSYSTSTTISAANGYYYLEDDSTYFVKLYDLDYSAFATTVSTLKGTSFDNAIEISDEQTTSVAYLYAAHTSNGATGIYLEFTPEETAYYQFYVSSSSNYTSLYLYSENDKDTSITSVSYNSQLTTKLEANTTYYLRAYYSSGSYNSSYTFNVSVNEVLGGTDRNTAIELQLGENEAEAWEVLENQYYMYFKFQPEISGVYSFTLSDESGYNPYYIYTSASGSSTLSAYTVGGKYVWYMTSGTTYYLYYSLSTGYGEFGVNVEQVDMGVAASDAIELELGKAISTGYNSSFNTGYSIWYKFTPTTSGNYVFSLTNANTRYLYLYDDANDSTSISYIYLSDSGSSWKQYLTANTTYYLQVYFTSSYDTSFEIGVREYKTGYNNLSANKLAVGASMNYGYNSSDNYNGEVWFEFTPDETAYYRFTSSNANSRYFYVYDSTMSSYVYQLSGYTSYSSYTTPYIRLDAGSTYYICVDFYSSYDSSFDMSVSTYDIRTLTVDNYISTGYDSNYYNQEMWYKFDTTVEGYHRVYVYNLYGSSSYRAYVEIYDADGNLINSGNTTNTSISVSSYDFEADSTYYVRVYFPNYTDGSFYVGLYTY